MERRCFQNKKPALMCRAHTIRTGYSVYLGRNSVGPGVDHNLGDVILLLEPGVIHIGYLIEGDAMRDDETGVNVALLHVIEQRLKILVHMGLAHLHGESLAESCAERDFVDETTVDAGDRYHATLAAGLDALA